MEDKKEEEPKKDSPPKEEEQKKPEETKEEPKKEEEPKTESKEDANTLTAQEQRNLIEEVLKMELDNAKPAHKK